MNKKPRIIKALVVSLALVLSQGCSFHLRETTHLPVDVKQLQIVGASENSGLFNALQTAIEEAGGHVSNPSNAQIRLSNIREGRRIVAYDSERKARIYLISLKLNYNVVVKAAFNGKGSNGKVSSGKSRSFPKQRINLDKTFLYDANFALGKVKEEEQIRESLYAEAARLILLRLRYR
jgi:outer membrane lipopolysaccharide assembly protein LptE/RlpB